MTTGASIFAGESGCDFRIVSFDLALRSPYELGLACLIENAHSFSISLIGVWESALASPARTEPFRGCSHHLSESERLQASESGRYRGLESLVHSRHEPLLEYNYLVAIASTRIPIVANQPEEYTATVRPGLRVLTHREM
jgi:hypothetical protein